MHLFLRKKSNFAQSLQQQELAILYKVRKQRLYGSVINVWSIFIAKVDVNK